MLTNGGQASSFCPSGLTCWLSAALEVRMVAYLLCRLVLSGCRRSGVSTAFV